MSEVGWYIGPFLRGLCVPLQAGVDGKSLREEEEEEGEQVEEEEDGEGVGPAEPEALVLEEDMGGYSGIKLESVQDIIAKARFTETFLSGASAGSTMAGVSDSLEELAALVEEEEPAGTLPVWGRGYGAHAELSSEGGGGQQDGSLNLEGISEEEMDAMLLSEQEVKIKTQLWFAENGDFLKEQEGKWRGASELLLPVISLASSAQRESSSHKG